MNLTRRGLLLLAATAIVAACDGRSSSKVASDVAPLLEETAAPERQDPPPAEVSTPVPRRVAVSAEEVLRGPANRPFVSLVFNAGAGFAPAMEILDVLASKGVRATFFLMGWWAERNPELVRRIQASGNEIASHGYGIFDLTAASDDEVLADLQRADATIGAITGQTTRPLWSPSAGYRDARVRAIAAKLGYRTILWSQDSGDWQVEATAEEVRRKALAGAEPGAIIVMHLDSTHSRSATGAVLAEVIDGLRSRGLEPVTITDLVGE